MVKNNRNSYRFIGDRIADNVCYNHLQQAQAMGLCKVRVQTEFDGLRMGDYFEGFVNEEARNLGKTLAEIKAWTPPVRTATRSRKKAK